MAKFSGSKDIAGGNQMAFNPSNFEYAMMRVDVVGLSVLKGPFADSLLEIK